MDGGQNNDIGSNAGNGEITPALNAGATTEIISSAPPLSGPAAMDGRLLQAATTGDIAKYDDLIPQEQAVLRGRTPQGNTFLHIATIHGHKKFCQHVLTTHSQSLLPVLNATNDDGETPLLTAVTRGRTTIVYVLLRFCREQHLSGTILTKDKSGFNALHHAICSGHRELALELIQEYPALSQDVNSYDESPMYCAMIRNYGDVLKKLLETPNASHEGVRGCNALHAAVTSGNAVWAKSIVEASPELVREENEDKLTPVYLTAKGNKIDVLTVLLEHDPSLCYFTSTDDPKSPLLCIAAAEGNVGVAQELLRHCPDPPYKDAMGSTCLHIAVSSGHEDFVRFVMSSPQLQHLVNLADDKRETALQLAQRTLKEANTEKKQTMMKSMVSVLQIHAQRITSGMENRLMEVSRSRRDAAVAEMNTLLLDLPQRNPGVLDGTTPQGNNCLHIAAVHGNEDLCRGILTQKRELLAAVNSDGETPLIAAVASGRVPTADTAARGRVSIAEVLFSECRKFQSKTILKQDNRGCNVLHHAIRGGHRELALTLIQENQQYALSYAVNQYGESPMFMAVMRNYEDVFRQLLEIPYSAHGGVNGENVLHAAVRNGNSDIARMIMERRPALAVTEDNSLATPLHLAVLWDKRDVLRVLLQHDRSLGYVFSSQGTPLLVSAAHRGHVGIARVLLEYCPDAPFTTRHSSTTCLHQAVTEGHMEFVNYVLGLKEFSRRIINMRDKEGHTALHLAVRECNPKMVAALLHHPGLDVTELNIDGISAVWKLSGAADHSKTLNWNEVSMLMLKANPQAATNIHNLLRQAQYEVIRRTRKDIKSLTQTYTGNTSVVAILIATITFAAAFTLPGGYSTDAGNEGLPIMARKITFKAFLISDALAMCSSLAVAFICVIAKWEDLEFLNHYRSSTKKLMWFAYIATIIAFATGLYTVLAPRLPWLAIAICILTSLLPILTILLGTWPILGLRFRLGRTFNSELLDMV